MRMLPKPENIAECSLDSSRAGIFIHCTREVHIIIDVIIMLVDNVQVQIKDGELVISGKRGLTDAFPDFTGKRQSLRQERQHGEFHRKIQLPVNACMTSGHVHAKVVEGVLEVTVDKAWGPHASDEVAVHF